MNLNDLSMCLNGCNKSTEAKSQRFHQETWFLTHLLLIIIINITMIEANIVADAKFFVEIAN